MSAGGNFYAFSSEQRANAHRRAGGASSKRAHQDKPEFDWDEAIARLRDMLDGLDRRR